MKEDNKLFDAIIVLGAGMKELREEMKGMRKDINLRLENLEAGQHKTNILLAEHSRSIIKLAEKITIVADHETRIIRLEDATLVKEPNAKYKKKKRNL